MCYSSYSRGLQDATHDVRNEWKTWFEYLPPQLQDAIREADAERRQRMAFTLASAPPYQPTTPIPW